MFKNNSKLFVALLFAFAALCLVVVPTLVVVHPFLGMPPKQIALGAIDACGVYYIAALLCGLSFVSLIVSWKPERISS